MFGESGYARRMGHSPPPVQKIKRGQRRERATEKENISSLATVPGILSCLVSYHSYPIVSYCSTSGCQLSSMSGALQRDLGCAWVFTPALLCYLFFLVQYFNDIPRVGFVEVFRSDSLHLISPAYQVEVVSTG